MLKLYPIVVMCNFLLFSSLFAQEVRFLPYLGNGQYGIQDTFPANGIADDFGPRRVAPNNWHGGIDYNAWLNSGDNAKGYPVLAPFAGDIVDTNRLIGPGSAGAKQIALDVGNYRILFVHLFSNSTEWEISNNNGSIVAKRMLGLNNANRWAMIIDINGQSHVFGQIDGFVEHNGDTLEVSNTIGQYTPIGPLGNSGTQTAHLHLNTIPDNQEVWNNTYNKNPLQFVTYAAPQYDIRLFTQPGPDSFVLNYPGSNPTPLCVRPRMDPIVIQGVNNNRYDRINDVDQVEVMLKKPGYPFFVRLEGAQKQGYISLGGQIGETQIGHTINQYIGNSPQWGNWATMGVNSFAYNSSNPHPYDDYYFPDFYTRIHKDHSGGTLRTAELPANARYPDGEYALFAQVTNVRGQVTGSDTLSFTLDNFKPYVQRVEVSRSEFYNSGSPFYIAAWEEYWQSTDWAGVGKLFFNVHQADPIQTTSGKYLKIVALTSELLAALDPPMQACNDGPGNLYWAEPIKSRTFIASSTGTG